jgi:hypothetical protein
MNQIVGKQLSDASSAAASVAGLTQRDTHKAAFALSARGLRSIADPIPRLGDNQRRVASPACPDANLSRAAEAIRSPVKRPILRARALARQQITQPYSWAISS